EDETGEGGLGGLDLRAVHALARAGRRSDADEGGQELVDPDLRHGRAEEGGRQFASEDLVAVEGIAGVLEQLDLLARFFREIAGRRPAPPVAVEEGGYALEVRS